MINLGKKDGIYIVDKRGKGDIKDIKIGIGR